MAHWLNLRGALTAAGALGRAVHRVRAEKPSPADVAQLFGGRSPVAPATIARNMSGLRYQNQLLVSIPQRRRSGLLAPYLDPLSLEQLKAAGSGSPGIFLTWHVGPPFGLLAAFRRLGFDVLVLRRTLEDENPTRAVIPVDRGPHARTRAVSRALAHLDNGGLVAIAGDGRQAGKTLFSPCLGRAARMARGPFALARISGAPIIPMLARWDDDGWMRITVGPRLRGEGTGRVLESSLAAEAGRWLESYLLTSPGQLRRCSLRRLLRWPTLEAARAGEAQRSSGYSHR